MMGTQSACLEHQCQTPTAVKTVLAACAAAIFLLRPYTMVSAKNEVYTIQKSMTREMNRPLQLIMLSS